jgi:hypothetical protein
MKRPKPESCTQTKGVAAPCFVCRAYPEPLHLQADGVTFACAAHCGHCGESQPHGRSEPHETPSALLPIP